MIYAVVEKNIVQKIISSTNPPQNAIEYPDDAEIHRGCDIRFFDKQGVRISIEDAITKGLIIVGDNQKALWDNGRYVSKDDYTSSSYWEKATGTFRKLELGERPDQTLTEIEPPDPLAVWKETGWTVPDEVLATRIRSKRDLLINEFGGRYQRYERETRLSLPHKLTIEQIDLYMQALADITLQPGFPQKVSWPEAPGEDS